MRCLGYLGLCLVECLPLQSNFIIKVKRWNIIDYCHIFLVLLLSVIRLTDVLVHHLLVNFREAEVRRVPLTIDVCELIRFFGWLTLFNWFAILNDTNSIVLRKLHRSKVTLNTVKELGSRLTIGLGFILNSMTLINHWSIINQLLQWVVRLLSIANLMTFRRVVAAAYE